MKQYTMTTVNIVSLISEIFAESAFFFILNFVHIRLSRFLPPVDLIPAVLMEHVIHGADGQKVSVTAIRVICVIAELFYYEPINEFDERSFI